MTQALIWPPVDTAEYGGTAAAAAYFAWFFGDVFDSIILPVASEPPAPLHSAFSIGALRQIGKVQVLRDGAPVPSGPTHVLITSKAPPPLPQAMTCRKMVGSERLPLPETADAGAALYYYIGSPRSDSRDAYLCVTFTYWHQGGRDDAFLTRSQERLVALKAQMNPGQAVSVFGTGPSIAEVSPGDHALDVSVICNTIVKNKAFCATLNVGVIVASDCHFHFSCNQYAFQFLSDLCWQLAHSAAIYVTFDKFAPFVLKKLPEHLHAKVCGIPAGRTEFGFDFDRDFRVLPGESVVNMFMLPVACFLSQDVRLCGFTGRAPSDSYFWSHADAFQYQDLLPTVRETHPGFFENRDYDGYANTVGDQLSARAEAARLTGVSVRSFTTSFYKGLEATKEA